MKPSLELGGIRCLYKITRVCDITGCGRKHSSQGFCDYHYRIASGLNEKKKQKLHQNAGYIERQRYLASKRLEVLMSRQKRIDRIKLNSDPIRKRYGLAVSEAKTKKRHQFNLTFEEFKALAEKPCFYCNGAFKAVVFGKGLDRIDNSKGYEPGNVIPACYTCNATRSNKWTVEETRVMIQAVIRFRQEKTLMVAA